MPTPTFNGSGAARRMALLWLVAAVSTVLGQDSDVRTCEAGLTWMVNSKGQTPCLLASYLQSQCRPMQVNGIPEGTHYLGPTTPAEANECICSTVVYNLISACGACQGRRWGSWPNWSTNCSTDLVSVGDPFPKGVPPAAEVPAWAYLDITRQVNQTWDPVAALQAGTEPLTTASSSTTTRTTSPPTTTPSQSPPPTEPTTNPPVPSSANSNGGSSGSNAGAIAGGVVGGIVFLVTLVLLVLWLILRKRKSRVNKDFVVDETKSEYRGPSHYRGDSQATMLNNFSPPMVSTTLPSVAPSYINSSGPMDMSDTRPMSPNSAVYTTIPGRRSFESNTQSIPSQFGSLVPTPSQRRGGYTGAAELS